MPSVKVRIHDKFALPSSHSSYISLDIFKWQPVSALISIQLTEAILGLRVYAVSLSLSLLVCGLICGS